MVYIFEGHEKIKGREDQGAVGARLPRPYGLIHNKPLGHYNNT